MGNAKITNSLNKTLQLTGIGLAVQAFYINLTLDSVLGGEFIQLSPAGPPLINPASVWNINGAPVSVGYNRGGYLQDGRRYGTQGVIGGNNYDANGYRDQNGYYHDNSGLRNGYDIGRTYGGGRDYGVTGVQGNAYGDVNGRNKGHQVAGFSTSYQKNESGNKATYYDDGLGHGGVVQYGLRDQRYKDGAGNAYGGGVHDSTLKLNALGNQGQYGGAGGYRNTDNRGGTLQGADVYRGGIGQGQVVSSGVLGPVASPPIYVQQPYTATQQRAIALPPVMIPSASSVPPVSTVPAVASSRSGASAPYMIPVPNKLYYDKPANVVVVH